MFVGCTAGFHACHVFFTFAGCEIIHTVERLHLFVLQTRNDDDDDDYDDDDDEDDDDDDDDDDVDP